MYGNPQCLVYYCFACVVFANWYAVDAEEASTRFDEPMVRICATAPKSKNEEVSVLGAAIGKGTVIAAFADIEGLCNLRVLSKGQKVSPRAIILLPEKGIAAILTDARFSADHTADVKVGDTLRIIRLDTESDTLIVTSGLASSSPRNDNGFLIDVAVGNPPKTGIVFDEKRRVLGMVVPRSDKKLGALDLKAIQSNLEEVRGGGDDGR